jgi:hypothetical protein
MLRGSKGFTHYSQKITVPVGTSGRISFKLDLPSEYNTASKVAISNIDISNQPNYKVSIANDREIFLKNIVNKLFRFDDSVAPDRKMLSVLFKYEETSRSEVIVECVDGAVAGTDLVFDLIFKVEDNDCDFTQPQNRDLPGAARGGNLEETVTAL